jgi:co-chaperonin GroES (HSP10)
MQLNKQTIQKKLESLTNQTQLLDLSNNQALGDYLIVIPVTITERGITSRNRQYEERPDIGLVISVGDDVTGIEPGDVVFFGEYSHFQVVHDSIEYLVLRQEDIFMKAG